MNEDHLIRAILDRAANPAIRTDYANIRRRELAPPATLTTIEAAERAMGCALHPLHRRLLEEVGNGGFGPGDGLVGLPDGSLDIDGRSIVTLRQILWLDAERPLPLPVVPLCDWGDGIWSCIDSGTGVILTLSELGLKDTGQSLHSWLADWVSGVNLWQHTVVVEDKIMKDPITKQTKTIQVVTGTRGQPYQSRQ